MLAMMMFAADKGPTVGVSAHLGPATAGLWGMLARGPGFVVRRPEPWVR